MSPSSSGAAKMRKPNTKKRQARIAASGKVPYRDRFVVEYLPLVRHVVSRIAVNLPAHVDTDELFQVGSVGLINASRGFDPERGVAFKTYAFALIRGAILDELRRLDLVPRSTREKIRAVDKTASRLSQELGRAPVAAEIATDMSTSEAQVVDLLRAARAVMMLSLDDGTSSPDALMVRDILPCPRSLDPGDAASKGELIEVVAGRIRDLPTNERKVITLYYREGLLLREIGAILGVTESRISQIHSRALVRLRELLV